jgi:dienelactone hydrolase
MTVVREVEYEAGGVTMLGRLAIPDGDDLRPAVLIAHEGPGLDDLQRERANRLAELGYVAFALDYHGGGRILRDRGEMMRRLADLWNEPEEMSSIAGAGLDVLLSESRARRDRVAAIGYCFGGGMVLELARSGADLAAVVGFHPRLSTKRPMDANRITARVLVCLGGEDPLVPMDERLAFEEEMRAVGVDWQIHVYGGAKHSFTHPWAEAAGMPELQYHEMSDRRSWKAMLDLLDEVLTR